ncbi:helix-turn-helix domain-containing protein [Curtobacterium sp. MCSS17_015]|uniref:winged helix-turn-helix domain-containing protein n=1 Tax=Curtobacterium sp. MCSS17_015 TaxID=2175666 RepID=UPI0015E8BB5F|nr:helix-turn-helix domain-containing protein [Curtobacterium sp. MCSS17_015]WIB26361.1 helix-turn-helix domain-containing protein [Curtobacterium sp. MCSS17_015]
MTPTPSAGPDAADGGPDPSRPRGAGRLDDPAHMRALAHPTRLRILGLLRTGGPHTAAMLGDQVDEAPGTISYHCTRLAAVGLIEPAPEVGTDRRERWWRAVHESSSWDLAAALDDPERVLAATALNHVIAGVYAARWEAFVERAASFGPAWAAASASTDTVLRLTADELVSLGAEVQAVVERWRPRSDAHDAGDGSEQVFVLNQAYRWPGA